MFTSERTLYHWLKENIPGDWQRIETTTGTGIPDANYCIDGVEGWAELKVIRRREIPRRADSLRLDIRKSQVAWLRRRAAAGGRTHVLIVKQTS